MSNCLSLSSFIRLTVLLIGSTLLVACGGSSGGGGDNSAGAPSDIKKQKTFSVNKNYPLNIKLGAIYGERVYATRGDVYGNRKGNDGQALNISIEKETASGSIVFEDGGWLYTPKNDFTGEDELTYRIQFLINDVVYDEQVETVTLNVIDAEPIRISDLGELDGDMENCIEDADNRDPVYVNDVFYLDDCEDIDDLNGIDKLPNLVAISFEEPEVSNYSLLKNISNLEYLYFDEINYRDNILFPELINLTTLIINDSDGGARYTDIEDALLKGAVNLQELSVDYSVGEYDLSQVAALTNLRRLTIDVGRFNSVSELAKLSELRYLHILGSPSEGNNEKQRIDVKNIETRAAEKTDGAVAVESFSVTDFSSLATLTNLQVLVPGYAFTDLEFLSDFNSVRHLVFNNYKSIWVLPEMASLESLNLRDSGIADLSLLSGVTNLKYLNIRDNDLTDLSGVSSLTSLVRIVFLGNDFTDYTPLSSLVNLEELDLSRLYLQDVSFLAPLTQLKNLNVYRNLLTSLDWAENLTQLEELNINDNLITDLSVLAGKNKLTKLSAGKNIISDISVLSGLSALQEIYLSNNVLLSLKGVSNLPALERLEVQYNKLSDISDLNALPVLSELVIYSNKLTDIDAVSSIKSLEYIQADRNLIASLPDLSALVSLEELSVSNNALTDVSSLENAVSLTSLRMSSNSITEGVSALVSLVKAENVSLYGNDEIPCADIDTLVAILTTQVVGEPSRCYVDSDGDGVADYDDVFPNDATRSLDSDGDGIADELETDADNDGIADASDPLPTDGSEWLDTDLDGVGDYSDNCIAMANPLQLDVNNNKTGDACEAAPVAIDDSFKVYQNISQYLYPTSNDTDAENDGLRIVSATAPTNGQVFVKNGGLFYVPSNGFSGADSFQYTINDGRDAGLATATVTLDVLANPELVSSLTLNDVGLSACVSRYQYVNEVRQLTCSNVSDLNGIEQFYNLESLTLSSGSTVDLTPLNSLIRLKSLSMQNKFFFNLNALTSLSGLRTLSVAPGLTDVTDIALLTQLTSLNLKSNKNITDLTPLSNLTALETLNLSNTDLTNANIPTGLASVKILYVENNLLTDISNILGYSSLRDLRITNNAITSLTGLSSLTQLEMLEASNNQIVDLTGLSGLVKLSGVYLYNNPMLTSLTGIGELPKLKFIRVSGSQITDVTGLGYMPSLTELNVSSNSEFVSFNGLVLMPKLTNVSINSTSISDFTSLPKLNNLVVIYASNNNYTTLNGLSGFLKLQSVYLSGSTIGSLTGIASLPSLVTLSLSNVVITDNNLSPISALDSMERIYLKSAGVSDITALSVLSNLKYIDMQSNVITDVSALASLINIQTLYAQNNEITTGVNLLTSLVNSSYISLYGNENIPCVDLDALTAAEISFSAPRICFSDMDGDGVADTEDDFPNNPAEQYDTDGDGIGNNVDTDDDGDGIADALDALPLDRDEYRDSDGDGIGDRSDNCLAIANPEQTNINNNSVGDACEVAPVARDNTVTVYQDIALLIDVLVNDSDVDGGAQAIASVTQGTNGIIAIEGDKIRYTPAVGYTGADSFTYTMNDGRVEGVSTATVTIDVVATPVLLTSVSIGSYINSCVRSQRPLPIYVNEVFQLNCYTVYDMDGIENMINLVRFSTRNGSNRGTGLAPLAGLVRLEQLSLYSRGITDVTDLVALTKLTELSLSRNAITDISGLSALTELKKLDLTSSSVTDISVLSNFTQLETLYLSSVGNIADHSVIGLLTKLTRLSLGNTGIGDGDINFAALTQLSVLDLPSNALTDVSFLQSMPNLTLLNISSNQLIDITQIPTLNQLSALTLDSNLFTSLSGMNAQPRLLKLSLSNNPISSLVGLPVFSDLNDLIINGVSLDNLSGLSGLLALESLSAVNVSIGSLQGISNLPALREIDLEEAELLGISFAPLASLPALDFLNIDDSGVVDISSIALMINLNELSAQQNAIVDISALKTLTSIEEIDLRNNEIVSGVAELVTLTNIDEIDLYGNQGIPCVDLITLSNAGVYAREPAQCFSDADGDGIADYEDVFPNNPAEWYDTDEDGIGNNTDTDDDNDGIADTVDALPLNEDEFQDSDGDGVGDRSDNCIDIVNPLQENINSNSEGDACEASPIAADDLVTVYQNIALLIDVLPNDMDPDRGNQNIVSVTQPVNGVAVIDNGKVKYTPVTGYIGADSFTYTMNDGRVEGASTATVTIDVVSTPVLLSSLTINSYISRCLNTQTPTPVYANEIFRLNCGTVYDFDGIENFINLTYLSTSSGSNRGTGLAPIAGLTRLNYLSLYRRNISDVSELSALSALTYLNLTNNPITDISSLSAMTGLKELYLSNTQPSDISVLSGFTQLEILTLNGQSNITDYSAIGLLTSLTTLNLDENGLSDGAIEFSGLVNMLYLSLEENGLSDVSFLQSMPKLKSLDLTVNQLTDISSIPTFANLNYLSVYGNNLTSLSGMQLQPRLRELGLGKNQFTSLSELPIMPNLESLYLNQFELDDLSGVSGLVSLSRLQLTNGKLLSLSGLSNLPALNDVDFEDTLLTGVDLNPLTQFSRLASLSLNNTSIDNIQALGALTNLYTLNLRYNDIVDVSALSTLVNTRYIYLRNNKIVSGVPDLVTLTSLYSLDLRDNYGIPCVDLDVLQSVGVRFSRPKQCFSDADGDGIADYEDVFPNNPLEWYDTDEDGIGNNTDTDDDGDSVLDEEDAFPLDASETVDSDGDGVGDNGDNCPVLSNPDQLDANYNKIGDVCESAPTALNDSYVIYQDIALLLDVTTNDNDTDDDDLTVQSVGVPSTGIAVLINSVIRYTPASGFTGMDSFTYTISDGTAAGVATATVNVNVVATTVLVSDIVVTDTRLQNCLNNSNKTYANEIFTLVCTSLSDLSGIESLVNLSNANLSRSNFVANLAPLSSLNRLSVLNLYASNISDISDLSLLVQLTNLNVSSNSLTDISALAGLTNLIDLNLYNNRNIADFSVLENLVELSKLNIGLTGLSDNDAGYISGLSKLQNLDVSRNEIASLDFVNGLINLRVLKADDNWIVGLSRFPLLPSLTVLDVGTNAISVIDGMALLPELANLQIDNNSLTSLVSLPMFPKLATLSISSNRLTDFTGLSGRLLLRNINASRNNVTSLSGLSNLPQLNTLSLSSGSIGTLSGLNNVPKLRDLSLVYSLIADADLTPLSSLVLTRLNLSNTGISDITQLASIIFEGSLNIDLRNNDITDVSALSVNSANRGYIYLNNNDVQSGVDQLTTLTNMSRIYFSENINIPCADLDALTAANVRHTAPVQCFIDTDGDGVADHTDAFINDPTEQFDTDNDGIGNNADDDDDGDGVLDVNDALPLNAAESNDMDGDGVGDNADNCVDIANADQFDANRNGKGDVCDAVPLAVSDYIVVYSDTPLIMNLTANDTDTDGDTLSVVSVIQPVNGTVGIKDGQVLYVPSSDGAIVSDSFEYTVSDGRSTVGSTATVNITIDPNPVLVSSLAITDTTLLNCINSQTAAVYANEVFRLSCRYITDFTGMEALKNLTWLSATNGTLTSDLSAFSELSNMSYLILGAKGITDISGLQGLTNLRYLDLYSNRITDLSALALLTKLETLKLSGNALGSNISTLPVLSQLSELSLFGNSITDISVLYDAQSGNGFTQLVDLNIGNNPIVDLGALSGLSKLEKLDMSSIRGAIVDYSPLSSLVLLKDLDMSSSNLVDVNVSALSSLTALEVLDLSSNTLTSLSFVSTMTQLNTLDVSANRVADLSSLPVLNKLLDLNLSTNSFVDLSGLPSLPVLQKLTVNGCLSLVNLTGFPELPLLTDLSVSSSTQLSSLVGMPLSLPSVKTASFTSNAALTDLTGISEMPVLDRLSLDSTGINDFTGLPVFPKMNQLNGTRNNYTSLAGLANQPALVTISMSYSNFDTLTGMSALPVLTTFIINNSTIVDDSLVGLSAFISITSLNVSNMPALTDIDGVSTLINLRYFGASGSGITDVSALSGIMATSVNLNLRNNAIATGVASLAGLTSVYYIFLIGNTGIPCADLDALTAAGVRHQAPSTCVP